jgi:SAM-dependent methyltransferase
MEDITRKTYSNLFEKFKEETPNNTPDMVKDMLSKFADNVKDGLILEIGSAHMRDYNYMTNDLGLNVVPSDYVEGFLSMSPKSIYFDVRSTDISSDCLFDGIVANAVLLHLNDVEFEKSLKNIAKHLKVDGSFAFSVKTGEDIKYFSDHKVDSQRFFRIYNLETLTKKIYKSSFFDILEIATSSEVKFTWIFCKKK